MNMLGALNRWGWFDRFAYPDYAAATMTGVCLVVVSFLLAPLGVHPLLLLVMRYFGILLAFFGTVWYGFYWFIDHGTKLVAERW